MRQFQERAKEGDVLPGPVGDFHKVIAAGQHATDAQDEDVLEAVLEIPALATGIGDDLHPRHEFARHQDHETSSRAVGNQ